MGDDLISIAQIAAELKAIRLRLGLSLTDAQKLTGIATSNICNIENGRRPIGRRSLRKFADGYKCRVVISLEPFPAPTPAAKRGK